MSNQGVIENTSGQGKKSVVPSEVQGWNWGAFFLNWIWGIGNSTYIALLMFVPLVNFFMLFVLGMKGSEWAWRNRVWRDVEHFKKTQRKWAWAGLIIVVVLLPSCVGVTMTTMKKSEAFRLSFAEVQRNEEINNVLGGPISSGLFVTGSISTSGPDGKAALQYSVSGQKEKGEVLAYAIKQLGRWELMRVVVDVPNLNKRIVIVGETKQTP